MEKRIEYKGRSYMATITEWTSGESTAVASIGGKAILLYWRRYTDREGGEWYRKPRV